VADAIRTKAGSSESLAFPDGFVTAVEGITTGGGGDTSDNAYESLLRKIISGHTQSVSFDMNDFTPIEWIDNASYPNMIAPYLCYGTKISSLSLGPGVYFTSTFQGCVFDDDATFEIDSDTSIFASNSSNGLFKSSINVSWPNGYAPKKTASYMFAYTSWNGPIVVSEGVETITKGTFYGISQYKASVPISLTLPSTLTTVESDYGTISGVYDNYLNVIMLGETPPTLNSSSALTYINSITVPKGCLEAYQSATNWSAHADIIVEATE